MKKIYVSGRMSGIKDYNYWKFAEARGILKNQGWEVIIPHAMDSEEGDGYDKERATGVWQSDNRSKYLCRDLQLLLSGRVDAVYMLIGWQESQGATLERDVALAKGLEVLYEQYPRTTASEFLAHQDAILAPYHPYPRAARVDTNLEDLAPNGIQRTSAKTAESILLEAHRIVHGERGADYGHPLDDFGRTCGMLNALLKHKLREPLVEEDIASMMICVKLSRDMNKPNRDNLRDIAGYAETKQMVRDERVLRLERERIEHEGAGGAR